MAFEHNERAEIKRIELEPGVVITTAVWMNQSFPQAVQGIPQKVQPGRRRGIPVIRVVATCNVYTVT